MEEDNRPIFESWKNEDKRQDVQLRKKISQNIF